MAIGANKLRVLIPTTRDPVEVMLLTEEDPVIGRCVACIGGTTETADIAAAYHAFVVRPTGAIERLFGHSCYRLDVSGRIDAGSSWQLGVLIAHALHAEGRLAQEKDATDGVVWATGSVRPVDLTVGGVSHVPEKLANSIDRLKEEARAGRRVWLVIPAQNADSLTADMLADLRAHGIEMISVADAQSLSKHLGLAFSKPAQPANRQQTNDLAQAETKQTASKKRTYLAVAGGVAIVCVAFVLGAIQMLRTPATQSASISKGVPPAAPHMPTPLVPELVPFVTDHEQATIRDVYMPAPGHKALALGAGLMRFVTDQPDKETAETAALAACQTATDDRRKRKGRTRPGHCELYASGNSVVATRGHPPMPHRPWVIQDPSVETPFAVADIPLVTDHARQLIERSYPTGRAAKAFAISPTGIYVYLSGQSSIEEAIRRSLERCGHNAGVACMIIALDDKFVVPIPRSMKVVGFFHPEAINSVAPEFREEIVRRFVSTGHGWSALAIGASGRIGMKIGAKSETQAVNESLEACNRQDRDCRVVVIGPFLVEHEPGSKPVRSP
jgi:hypothetical protein